MTLHGVKIRPDVDPNDDPENPFGGYRLDGLYALGPLGMRCALAALIAHSLLRVTGRTAYGERRAWIRERAEEKRRRFTPAELRAMELERRQARPQSGYGLYGRSTKPTTSGRKRRAA
jgi:hypothetical protein